MLHSMRAQTSAIIVAGFVLSHVAAYFIYTEDRRDAVLITEALDIAERAAGVSRLLRDLPPDWRQEIVQASDSRAFSVWTTSSPPFENVESTGAEDDLLFYLRSQLPRLANGDMRVRLGRIAHTVVSPPNHSGGTSHSDPSVGAKEAGMAVAIAISHGDQEWINFLGHINTPSAVLPEFLGISIISAVFAVGLVAFWLVHRVTVPLSQLANAAERLGSNIYAEPLSETGPHEVATAAGAFNRMQRQLIRLIESRTELLAAISHDLRTPITQMRLRTELMPASAERNKTLASLDEMEAIVSTFLDYAWAVSEAEERSHCDIRALVESICSDLADTGAEITCDAENDLVMHCKRLAVKRAVTNLLDNALKYAGSAHAELRREAGLVVIRIDDDGPGIPDEDLDAVLAPFYRGESSRNRQTGGLGLGLSIVQAIAEDHGGEVRLSNRKDGGLRAELILPA